MTEEQLKDAIKDLEVGAKIQLIKSNGDIIDVTLASHDTQATEEIKYDNLVIPAMPPAIIVQGGRWGTYRIDVEEIVNIAEISKE